MTSGEEDSKHTKTTVVRVIGNAGNVNAVLDAARQQFEFKADMETLAAPGEATPVQRVTITANDPQVAREACAMLAQRFGRIEVEGTMAGF